MTTTTPQTTPTSSYYISSTFYKNVCIGNIPEIESNDTISFRTIHNGAIIKNDGTNWNHIKQPVKSDVLLLIRKEISTFDKPDVQVVIGEAMFNCHKILLDCYSGYFRNMSLDKPIINLPSEKIKSTTFIKIYEWMLATDSPRIERPGMMELFVAANFLQINDFITHFFVCIDNLNHFNEDSAFVLYWEARTFNETQIQELMLPRIQKFFLTMVTTTEFLEMTSQELCSFLKSNTIGIRRESDVFYSALTWLFNNWEEREVYVFDIMNCVRFNLMTPWELSEIRNDNKSIEVRKITKITGILEIIDEALTYVSAKYWSQENCVENVVNLLKKFKIESTYERKWIQDKNYVDPQDIPNSELNRYEAFRSYLKMICNETRIYWKLVEFTANGLQDESNPQDLKIEETEEEQTSKIDPEIVNPKILIFGGINPHEKDDTNTGQFVLEYNPTTNSFKKISEIPEPRQHHSVVMLNELIYLAGGTNPNKNSQIVSTMWSFNQKDLTWRNEPDLPVLIRDFGFVATNEKIYVFGGETNDNQILNSVFSFNPITKVWKKLNSMMVPRAGLSTVHYQNNIIVAGGIISIQENCSKITKSVEFYNIQENEWYSLDDLRIPRCYAKMCMIENNIFIIAGGGKGNDEHISSLDSFDLYDVKNAIWKLQNYCLERHGHDVAVLSGNIFIFGGICSVLNNAVDSVECYNFKDNCMVKDVENLPTKISGLACISYDSSCN